MGKIPPQAIQRPRLNLSEHTEKEDTFRLAALVWCRPETLERKNQ